MENQTKKLTNFESITNISKTELLNEVALNRIEAGFCHQCGRIAEPNKFYSIVGRHEVISEKEHFKFVGQSGLPEIRTTKKYIYQGAYIPLCEICYRNYKWIDKVALFSAILLVVGIIGTFSSIIIGWVFKISVSFGFPFYILFMIMPFVFWFLKEVILDKEKFSRKTVKLTQEFSGMGVPNVSDGNLLTVAMSYELEKLLEVINN